MSRISVIFSSYLLYVVLDSGICTPGLRQEQDEVLQVLRVGLPLHDEREKFETTPQQHSSVPRT
jgi:hypothetical protein